MFSMKRILIPALLAALPMLSSAADSITVKAVKQAANRARRPDD